METVDLVMIGAPKCGTSSLFGWLDVHPEFQGSQPKETFFLMDLEHPLCRRHGVSYSEDGLEAWDQFFREPADGRIRFEATTHYYYQQTAREVLAASEATVVMVLRRPADRLRSSFYYTQENLAGIDRAVTFQRYADALLRDGVQELRGAFRNPTSYWIAERELNHSTYVKWIDGWVEAIGRERLHIVLFDDLTADPLGVVRCLAERMGADASWYNGYDFAARNATVRVRHQLAHRLARRWGARIAAGRMKSRLKQLYHHLQLVSPPSTLRECDLEALVRLDAYFRPYDAELSDKYGLDTSRWCSER